MIKVTIEAAFRADVQRVWDMVADNRRYDWRSDLSRIDLSEDGTVFTEYTHGGFSTVFTVTRREPCRLYAFDMRNRNLTGHWEGRFRQTERGAEVVFTEEVSVRSPFLRLLAPAYLKKQQKQYVADLRRTLVE